MLGSSMALGAFFLPDKVVSAAPRVRASGVVVLMLEGGMSHLDSWDPKPRAPAEVRGEFRPIATTVPSVHVSEYLPALARQAHLYNLIRSVHCDARNDHSPGMHLLLTGWENTAAGVAMERFNYQHPSQGSIVAHQLGVTSTRGLPRFVALPRRGQIGGQVNFATPAFLGPGHDAWETGAPPASASRPMTLPPSLFLSPAAVRRLNDRVALRRSLSRLHADLDRDATSQRLDNHFEQAHRVLAGQQLCRALDLSQEPLGLRERYGNTLVGQSLLLARRLVEAGVSYVLVDPYGTTSWDFHSNNFSGHRNLLPPLDRALSTFIADLDQRGLLPEVLVLAASEMGRTPRVNNSAGRDHWTHAFSVLLAGGGTTRGQVLGSTTSQGEWPSSRPVTVPEILATLYHRLGIDPNAMLRDEQGRPMAILPDTRPIRELLA
jgi:hypothetical protein